MKSPQTIALFRRFVRYTACLAWLTLGLEVILPLFLFYPAQSQCASATPDPCKWTQELVTFEKQDRLKPPPKNPVLFVGSSTIARWKTLATDFQNVPVLNRGFGGSQVSDIDELSDRVIFRYSPGTIFFRAGSNDLHAGKSPETICHDFLRLCDRIKQRLPDTSIYYIALCPSLQRKAESEKTRRLNDLIRIATLENPAVHYVDAWAVSLDSCGKIRPELFGKDRLHFNALGYKILADRIRPFVESIKPAPPANSIPNSVTLPQPQAPVAAQQNG